MIIQAVRKYCKLRLSMCGIFGIIDPNITLDHASILKKADQLITHRGPDDFGILSLTNNKNISLGRDFSATAKGHISFLHRRLSILDLSETGWQPMASQNNKYFIIFNGEIYNYQEIRKELVLKGYSFKSNSDTEVLLNAYIEWKEDCLNKFIGMFAFAILDLEQQVVFCARDFFGIKPFYYVHKNGVMAFSSEVKPLLTIPFVSNKANNQLVYEYLLYSQQEGTTRCFWQDVNQLPPAHYLVYNLKEQKILKIKQYWHLESKTTCKMTPKQASSFIAELFETSIKLHLRSDVPVAANLSGGIDSSSIVMVAKKILGDVLELSTISFIAEDEDINEEKWIDIINETSGAKPIKVYPKGNNLIQDIENLIYAQEEPFGSSSPYAQFKVFKTIQENNIKVVLDGQGADEMLAGYRSYLYAYMESLVKQGKFMQAIFLGFSIMRLPGMALTMKNLLKLLISYTTPLSPIDNNPKMLISSFPKWLRGEWFMAQELRPFQWWRPTSSERMKEQLHYTFINSSLPHLLRIADRNSMYHSVESRLPFLTPQLAEFIFSIPESYIISLDAYTKKIFRMAMDKVVPKEILSRKDKIGFTTPEAIWLRENQTWVKALINSSEAKKINFIDIENMNKEWDMFVERKIGFDGKFWRWINLILWTRIFNISY